MTVIGAAVHIKKFIAWYPFLMKHRLPLSLKRTGFSMETSEVEVLIDVISGYRTSESLCVVELGPGFSTLVLASVLPRLHNNGHIVSIEGDEYYMNKLRNQITAYGLDDIVSLHQVPYVVGTDECWFDRDILRRILGDKKVDILVVDAPPGGLCPLSRRPAIPFFLSYLKQNSIVFLHDTIRQDESDIAKEWSGYFDTHHRVGTLLAPKGLDVFENPAAVTSSQG